MHSRYRDNTKRVHQYMVARLLAGRRVWGYDGFRWGTSSSISSGQTGPRQRYAPDAPMRTAQHAAVNGYHIKASDGIIGHVCDF